MYQATFNLPWVKLCKAVRVGNCGNYTDLFLTFQSRSFPTLLDLTISELEIETGFWIKF